MKNKIFYIIITIIAITSLWMIVSERVNDQSNEFIDENKPKTPELILGNQTIVVEIVKTDADRAQGLSGREFLAENTGMLFIFDKPDYYYFWMKDMKFPIDIVWLDENYKIVDITKNLSPTSYPKTVTSKEQAQYILEVNANFTDQTEAKIGDIVQLLKNDQ